jgi:hypothetical protein
MEVVGSMVYVLAVAGCRGLELMGEQQLAAWRTGFGTTSMIPGVRFAAS